MEQEWIRPSVHVAYEVSLDNSHALKYSNLWCRYMEERVQRGRRGFVVVKQETPLPELRITGEFAWMDVRLVDEDTRAGPARCELKAEITAAVLDNNQRLDGLLVLPYGSHPIGIEEVGTSKLSGLITYFQRRILGNFEADAIRAVIGEYTSVEDIQREEITITSRLQNAWKGIIHYAESPLSEEELKYQERFSRSWVLVRTLYSPVVDSAIKAIQHTYA